LGGWNDQTTENNLRDLAGRGVLRRPPAISAGRRAAAFVAKYGDLAVELDALPVEDLTRRIRSGIEEHMNMDALAESHRLEDEQRDEMRELAEELGNLDRDNGQDS
jgi:hypothetical protein